MPVMLPPESVQLELRGADPVLRRAAGDLRPELHGSGPNAPAVFAPSLGRFHAFLPGGSSGGGNRTLQRIIESR